MKLNTKMYLGLAVPAVMLVGISGFSLYSFWRIDSQIGTIYDDRVVPMQELKLISDDYAVFVIDAVNKAHAGMWTMDQAYSSVNSANERIKGNWQKYKSTNITPEEEQLVSEIEVLFVQADVKITQLKKVLQTSKNSKILDEFDGPIYSYIDPLTHKIQELIDLQLRVAKKEREEAAILYNNIRTVFIGLAILAVIVASPIGFLLSQYVIATLKQTIDVVASASTEIAAAAEEQERIAEQQAVACTQVNNSMAQLNSFSSKSAEQANAVAKAAQQALVRTQNSSKVMNQTLERVSELEEKIGKLGERIALLSEQTNQIGNISQLVRDLANQTNMLALNAAVEAVRAGEGGKGFAIVAVEIRKLADQSKQSAENINSLVVDLQTAINATVGVTQRSIETAGEGVKTVGEMAAAFKELVDAVHYSATITQDISQMVKEQLLSIQQVVEVMQSINTGAQESAQGISQTKIGIHKLNETAIILKAVV